MTREEILNMPASKKMDRLISEKLLPGSFGNYSTDIAAAWEVVKRMAHEPFAWHIESVNTSSGLRWFVCYWGDGESGEIVEFSVLDIESLPLAICRVALLAALPL